MAEVCEILIMLSIIDVICGSVRTTLENSAEKKLNIEILMPKFLKTGNRELLIQHMTS
jgi:cation transporter-like permease